jgi:hypothetical protein
MSLPLPSQIVEKMRLPPGSCASCPSIRRSPLNRAPRMNGVARVGPEIGAIEVREGRMSYIVRRQCRRDRSG